MAAEQSLLKLLLFCAESQRGAREKGKRKTHEIIEALCSHFSLQLYVDASPSGINYMISGKAFVVDLFYSYKQLAGPAQGAPPSQALSRGASMDNVSIGSANSPTATNITAATDMFRGAAPPVDFAEDMVLDDLVLSFVDESWAPSFSLFTLKLYWVVARQDYVSLFHLLKGFLAYDHDHDSGDGREARSFASVYSGIRRAEELLSAALPSARGMDFRATYSFEEHKILLLSRAWPAGAERGAFDLKGVAVSDLDLSSGCSTTLFGHAFAPSAWKEFLSSHAGARGSFLRFIAEAAIFGIPARLDLDNSTLSFALPGDGPAAGREVVVTSDSRVFRAGELEDEMTIVLKRRASLLEMLQRY